MRSKEYIYIETNESCALCGLKGIKNLTQHHIDKNKENNNYDNLIILCRNCHCKHHEKKGITKKQILKTKKRLIIKTLTQYGLSALKISKRNGFGVVAMPFLLHHLVDMGLMKQKENQMGYGAQKDATARFAITTKGIKLYNKWF